MPRLRFDLSAYGDRRNYFIKDHKFSLKIKSLIADENSEFLGGGQIGVWIHTDPVDGLIWSWTNKGKWEPIREERLSRRTVISELANLYNFELREPDLGDKPTCLANVLSGDRDITLKDIRDSFFEDVTFTFDTRNFTDKNNFEYLKIIPIEDTEYVITEQVNRDDTNYVVEIFFVPQSNDDKYLLIDNIELQDVTLRDYAGIGTGHGIESSGTPLRRFVYEDKLELSKDQLVDVLKFYNGMLGLSTDKYATVLASRDATITSGTLEVSGGSRLNYRVHPDWVPYTPGSDGNYIEVRFEN